MATDQKTWIDILGTNITDTVVDEGDICRLTGNNRLRVLWNCDTSEMADLVLAQWHAEVQAMFPPLDWTFDYDQTEWNATSNIKFDDVNGEYKIVVCNDGTFDVSQSDSELVGKHKVECLPSLKDAQKWCYDNDLRLADEIRKG